MVLQGFLVALIASLIYMESRIGGQHMLDRPIIIGPLVGLVMGDLTTGLIIGGQLELVWMGLVGIGTSTPPDVVVGSALATALAIQSGADYQTTLAIAIPVSILAQMVAIGVNIVNTFFVHIADRLVAEKNYKGVAIGHWLGAVLFFSSKFILIFVGFMVGSDIIMGLVERIPDVIQQGLSQAASLFPALGVAMLMQLMFDKKYAAFLFLGFSFVAFFEISTIGVALVGAVIAYIYYQFKPTEGDLL